MCDIIGCSITPIAKIEGREYCAAHQPNTCVSCGCMLSHRNDTWCYECKPEWAREADRKEKKAKLSKAPKEGHKW